MKASLQRVGTYVATLAAVATLIFFLPRLLPGDPLNALIDPEAGQSMTPETRAALEAHYGLDKPVLEQFGSYMAGVATFDFGWSISRRAPVSQVISARLPWTLLLMSVALVISSVVSFIVGVQSAWRRRSTTDRVLVGALTTARSVPEYAVAAVLLIVFAVLLPWFPVAGNRTLFAQHSSWFGATLDVAHHLVLPVLALSLSMIGTKFLLVRNTVIGVLGQDYMVLARAKGLPVRIQKYRHAGRNALLPFLTVLGLQVGFAVGGTIFVETVFTYPGMGTLILDAVNARDYPLLEALFLVLAAIVLAANLLIDLLYLRVDPTASRAQR